MNNISGVRRGVCGCLLFAVMAFQTAAATVERTIDGLTVTLSVAPSAGTAFQFIDETLPPGFAPENITGGGAFDAINGQLKWGLFFDDLARDLKYDLIAPEGFSGLVELVGSANFDGTSVATTGASQAAIGDIPQPPVFVNHPQSVTVIEGETIILSGEVSGTPPLSYQWTRDGASVLDETEPALLLAPSVPDQSGIYRLVASNAEGNATSDAAFVVIEPKPPEPTGPLAIAIDSPFLFWTSGGAGEWIVDEQTVSFGESSITFDDISEGERTWIETAVQGPGTLTFRWKVSSESCGEQLCDFAQFSLNGQTRRTLAGEEDWQSVVLTLPIGEHHLRWDYIKDDFTTTGDDKVWLDGFAFGEGFPVPVKIVGPGTVSLAPNRLLYSNGDQILLQATPEDSAAFQAWANPIHSAEEEIIYRVKGFQTITALFGDDFAGALDTQNQVWNSAGNLPWSVIEEPTATGGLALRSGDLNDSESSSIASRFIGPGVLRFRWKVSSEFCPDAPCDFMAVSVNGAQKHSISGEVEWEEVTLHLPSGRHDIVWHYQKDNFTTEGEDSGWLDNVRFEPRQIERAPITGLEYFVNEDPGEGNGIPLAIDQSDFDLPMQDLEPGLHFITFRAKEEVEGETRWSHHNTVPFTVKGVDDDQQLFSLEYFIDDDPGDGNRINVNPAALDVGIPVDGLSAGTHRLGFRIAETFRGVPRWSPSTVWPFSVAPEDFTGDISAVEYYVGEDPGFGNGIKVPSEGGLVEVPANGLDAGYHLLTVRALQAGPGLIDWSHDTQLVFEVLPSTATDDTVVELAEIRFAFLSPNGELTSPFTLDVQGNAVFDGQANVMSDLLRQPGPLIGRAIATNVLGEESPAAWFSIEIDGEFSSPWQNWLSLHFTPAQLTDENIVGPNADPDGDGLPNLLELATGGNPLESDSSPGLVKLRRSGTGELEIVTRALSSANPSPSIPHESQGLRYEIESASDAFAWLTEPLPLVAAPTVIADDISELIYRLPIEISGPKPRFFRLKVTPTESFSF